MCHRYIDCNVQYMACGHTTGDVYRDVSCGRSNCTTSHTHSTSCQYGMSATCGTCNGQGFACRRHHTCRSDRRESIRPSRYLQGYCPNHPNMCVLLYHKLLPAGQMGSSNAMPDFRRDNWTPAYVGTRGRPTAREDISDYFFFFLQDLIYHQCIIGHRIVVLPYDDHSIHVYLVDMDCKFTDNCLIYVLDLEIMAVEMNSY